MRSCRNLFCIVLYSRSWVASLRPSIQRSASPNTYRSNPWERSWHPLPSGYWSLISHCCLFAGLFWHERRTGLSAHCGVQGVSGTGYDGAEAVGQTFRSGITNVYLPSAQLISDQYIPPPLLAPTYIHAIETLNCQLSGGIPYKREMDHLCFALQHEHFAFFGPSREESILNRACRWPKIYMGREWRFLAAPALHNCGYPLAVRTSRLQHNFIGTFWTHVKIDHSEHANHNQQNGCKGQRAQDHLSCERVFNFHRNLFRCALSDYAPEFTSAGTGLCRIGKNGFYSVLAGKRCEGRAQLVSGELIRLGGHH